jgi:hypothetical protein
MTLQNLINDIKSNVEWLETTEYDSVECISLENLESILSEYFNKPIKLSQ